MVAIAGEDLDLAFLQALACRLREASVQIAVARGRIRHGHGVARAHLTNARDYVQQLRGQVDELGSAAYGDGFRDGRSVAAPIPVDELLDVKVARTWAWSARFAGEDVALARSMLSRSRRHLVTRQMLVTVQDQLGHVGSGLEQLSRRAWGALS